MIELKTDIVAEIITKYPELGVVLRAGVVSIKLTREMLDIDRYLMQDIYKKLIQAGAAVGVSSSCFRASPAMLEYLKTRDDT